MKKQKIGLKTGTGQNGTFPNCVAQHGKVADWRNVPGGILESVSFSTAFHKKNPISCDEQP
jgi:hypothetical protein